jgi:hypothetical protein
MHFAGRSVEETLVEIASIRTHAAGAPQFDDIGMLALREPLNLSVLSAAGVIRPVAYASTEKLNRALYDRAGSAEEILYLALACGTAIHAETKVLRAFGDNDTGDLDAVEIDWVRFFRDMCPAFGT